MKETKTVLVCVTAQESSKALVETGKKIALECGADLQVVSVLPLEKCEHKASPQIIENLHQRARDCGAEMCLYFSDDPILTVSAHMAKNKPVTMVVGFPGEKSNNFIATIHLLVPDIPISMAADDGTIYNILPQQTNTPSH